MIAQPRMRGNMREGPLDRGEARAGAERVGQGRARVGRTLLFPMLAILLNSALPGCQQGPPQGAKVVTIFVDVSGSVRDFDAYREGWCKIVEKLKEGDRIVLGRITEETFTRFRPVLDTTVPVFNPLTDNRLRFEKRTKAIRGDLEKGVEAALGAPRSPKTDVMNSLVLAEKIFAGDKRHPVLVLFSDMLEDSDAYSFERVTITEGMIHRIVEEKRRDGQLPDLRGATVYVAGASAKSASKAHEVQRFWVEYMKAANARLLPQNYGPALINFAD